MNPAAIVKYRRSKKLEPRAAVVRSGRCCCSDLWITAFDFANCLHRGLSTETASTAACQPPYSVNRLVNRASEKVLTGHRCDQLADFFWQPSGAGRASDPVLDIAKAALTSPHGAGARPSRTGR